MRDAVDWPSFRNLLEAQKARAGSLLPGLFFFLRI